MKKQSRILRKGSKIAAASQPKTAPKTALRFRVRIRDTGDVIDLNLDSEESECLARAATSTHLSREELLHFIFLRQMESFNSESECYTVCGNAQSEVSDALLKSQKHGNAIESLAEALLEQLELLESKSVSRDTLRAWCGLIFDLAGRINRDLHDGTYHWRCHVVPALKERESAPGAQAPMPTTERRAA
jgi:hypothetical protein